MFKMSAGRGILRNSSSQEASVRAEERKCNGGQLRHIDTCGLNSNRPRRKKGEQLPLSDIDRGDSGISYPKTAATSRLSEPPIDAIQGRDAPEHSYSYMLLTSRSQSKTNVMSIEDDYGRAVPEIVLPEDTSFTYIGKHNSFLSWELGHGGGANKNSQ